MSHAHNAPPLLPVAEALRRILAEFTPLPAEQVSLTQSVGRVLAEPVIAPIDLPPFASSGMDGYALLAQDITNASQQQPAQLAVIGDIPAGIAPALEIRPGTAARIMTGAPLPTGADAVAPVEITNDHTSRDGGPLPTQVQVYQPVEPGANIRPAGEDVYSGQIVLSAGQKITPNMIGILASLGQTHVSVHRRPRVAVLSSGDELVDIGQPLGPGQIRNSNSHVVTALVAQYGGEPVALGIARDDEADVEAHLQAGLDSGADLLVTTAGVSMGARDVVRLVIERHGQLGFWRVNMRPGKPVAFGHYQQRPLIGLPGNPTSAFVTFEVFVRPVLLKLGGHRQLDRPTVSVQVTEPLRSDGRESYLRAVIQRAPGNYHFIARPAGPQGSNLMAPLAWANGLMIVPAGVKTVAAGENLTAWLLNWPPQLDDNQ